MKKEKIIIIFSFALIFIADLFFYLGFLAGNLVTTEPIPWLGIAIVFNIVILGLLAYYFSIGLKCNA